MDVALHFVGVASTPLKLTVLDPCVLPKFAPLIVTDVPTSPEVGERLVMAGAATTLKEMPLLLTPLACTTTLPVVAPDGTGATIALALQLVGVANVPWKLTVPVRSDAPKLLPLIVTEAPTAPELGERLLMLGAGTTVKEAPLLATVFTVTITLPVVAPDGTGATMEVALQLLGVDAVPLNLTVLVPRVAPKPLPLMVIDAPTGAELGERALMTGITVNLTPALAEPLTVTTTFPVVAVLGTGATMDVALQLVGVATTPLNLTVLVPWVVPKPLPVMVTAVPAFPDVGDKLVIFGAA